MSALTLALGGGGYPARVVDSLVDSKRRGFRWEIAWARAMVECPAPAMWAGPRTRSLFSNETPLEFLERVCCDAFLGEPDTELGVADLRDLMGDVSDGSWARPISRRSARARAVLA